MRLIDADALMKAMYHRAFETDGDTMWQSGCWVRYRAIEQVIREQLSVDAVEVVRCKDCKFFDRGTDEDGKLFFKCLGWVYGGTSEDDFCCHGERKDV